MEPADPGRPRHDAGGLSIGALSQAVGIPVPTLRTWETRYGYPVAVRLPSGHRRFPTEAVERLRLVGLLLERGHKPSSVVPADLDALRDLLQLGAPPAESAFDDPSARLDSGVERWFAALESFDGLGLDALLQEGWNLRGALPFLEQTLATFLVELGRRWREGRLDVGREHFATAVVSQFVARQWRAMSDVSRGPIAVCATLPGEQHVVGLHMAAVALALSGWRIRFLGADTPVDAIAASAGAARADAVVIGVSPAADRDRVRTLLRALRSALPTGLPIWAGGVAALERDGLARWISSLGELAALAHDPSVQRGR